MKNCRPIIIFLLALISLSTTTLTSARADALDVPFLSAIGAIQTWEQQFTQEINNLNKNIAEQMVDQANKQNEGTMNQAAADNAYKARQDSNQVGQAEVAKQHSANQQVMLDSFLKYAPSDLDCIMATNKQLTSYGNSLNLQQVAPTIANVNNNVHGITGGASANIIQTATAIQAAVKNPTSTDVNVIKNNPNQTIAEKQCTTSDCYNQWLQQKIINISNTSAGDKPPVNANMNPQIAQYFLQRAQWENEQSAASETLIKLLPKLFKRMDYYAQAQNDYVQSGISTNASDATTRLNLEYPNSPKIGLSYYELQEAEFAALTAGGQSILHVAENDSQRQRSAETLQAAAASLQVAKMERDQFQTALKTLGIIAPPVSASALSVSGGH